MGLCILPALTVAKHKVRIATVTHFLLDPLGVKLRFIDLMNTTVSKRWSARVLSPLKSMVMRGQICTTQGPQVSCVRQVIFG